jgi:hypothetical protein
MPRRLLMQASRNGYFFVLDRTNEQTFRQLLRFYVFFGVNQGGDLVSYLIRRLAGRDWGCRCCGGISWRAGR